MITENVEVFDKEWQKYDEWYDKNPAIFQSELKAISKLIPCGDGLEIGVGTGRFASYFRLPFGVDPAFSALCLSEKRNISVAQGIGEELPFKDRTFPFVLIVATLCFVKNPTLVLKETHRVLKNGGTLILAILNKSSAWGRFLQHKATRSQFFRNAQLHGSNEIFSFLHKTDFRVVSTVQTLFHTPPEVLACEEPQKGIKKGGFVVFKAVKDSFKKQRADKN
jgi:ubiquinone/menaquinone biosynthesis C-methylase UbiE